MRTLPCLVALALVLVLPTVGLAAEDAPTPLLDEFAVPGCPNLLPELAGPEAVEPLDLASWTHECSFICSSHAECTNVCSAPGYCIPDFQGQCDPNRELKFCRCP